MASKNDEGWDDPLVFYLTWPSDKAEYNLQTKLALKNYFLVNIMTVPQESLLSRLNYDSSFVKHAFHLKVGFF